MILVRMVILGRRHTTSHSKDRLSRRDLLSNKLCVAGLIMASVTDQVEDRSTNQS